MIHITLCLLCHVFILDSLNLIVTDCDGFFMLFLYFFYTFLLSCHFTKAIALSFLDRTATSIEPTKLLKMSWDFLLCQGGRLNLLSLFQTGGECKVMESP